MKEAIGKLTWKENKKGNVMGKWSLIRGEGSSVRGVTLGGTKVHEEGKKGTNEEGFNGADHWGSKIKKFRSQQT